MRRKRTGVLRRGGTRDAPGIARAKRRSKIRLLLLRLPAVECPESHGFILARANESGAIAEGANAKDACWKLLTLPTQSADRSIPNLDSPCRFAGRMR